MIIIRDDGLFDSVFLTLIAIVLGAMFIVLVFAEGPKLQVWLHRNDVRTVKTANYELLKKYIIWTQLKNKQNCWVGFTQMEYRKN